MCEKARRFLAKRNIPYTERDIEKDPGAGAELKRKAKAAGVKATGVPVFDVGGKILPGFDEGQLARLLQAG